MTSTSFLMKHGKLPAELADHGVSASKAHEDLRALQPKPDVQPVFWLWPDRAIGKKESRRLREEHNLAMNQRAEMAGGLRYLAAWLAMNCFPENTHHLEILRLMHAIENNLDIRPPTNSRGDN